MAKDLKENYIELEVTIEDQYVNENINLLGYAPNSLNKNPILYPFINVANSTLYIDNKKIDNFSLYSNFLMLVYSM